MLKWEMIEMQQKFMVLILLNTKNVKKLLKKRKLNCLPFDHFPHERTCFYRYISEYPVRRAVLMDFSGKTDYWVL